MSHVVATAGMSTVQEVSEPIYITCRIAILVQGKLICHHSLSDGFKNNCTGGDLADWRCPLLHVSISFCHLSLLQRVCLLNISNLLHLCLLGVCDADQYQYDTHTRYSLVACRCPIFPGIACTYECIVVWVHNYSLRDRRVFAKGDIVPMCPQSLLAASRLRPSCKLRAQRKVPLNI